MAVNSLSAKFLAIFLLLLFFASFERTEAVVERKICRRHSKTWSGWCGNSKHCDHKCRKWEDARHGACHHHHIGRGCFCYFNCTS